MGINTKSIVCIVAAFAAFKCAAFELKAGVTSRIPCDNAQELTYDLFIPSAYMSETERKFPVLFISNPGAHPDIHGGPRQAVLLIDADTVDELVARGYPVGYGALGENLTTSGIDRPSESIRSSGA